MYQRSAPLWRSALTPTRWAPGVVGVQCEVVPASTTAAVAGPMAPAVALTGHPWVGGVMAQMVVSEGVAAAAEAVMVRDEVVPGGAEVGAEAMALAANRETLHPLLKHRTAASHAPLALSPSVCCYDVDMMLQAICLLASEKPQGNSYWSSLLCFVPFAKDRPSKTKTSST